MRTESVLPEPGTCSSCGAAILWVKTSTGRSMPLDAKPEKLVVLTQRSEPEGAVLSVSKHEIEPLVLGQVRDCYRSHFATCPNAAKHRRAR